MKQTILFFALLVTGCGTSLAPTVDPDQHTRTLPADYPQVFAAILSFCSDNGYTVVVTDMQSGIISTAYARRPRFIAAQDLSTRSRVKFLVRRAAEHRTSVVALASIERRGRDSAWEAAEIPASQIDDFYDGMFRSISERLSIPD